MPIDAMLARLIEKLFDALGDVAAKERCERFSAPVSAWQGRDVIDFIDRMRRITGDDYMGLGASPCPLGTSDFVIELTSRCATLREAVTMGLRLMSLVTGALHFRLIEDGDMAVIEIAEQPSARDPEHALADWAMISWHKLCQWLIGTEIWLTRTEFDHALDATYSSYAAMFGNDCDFNKDACRLVFARTCLDRRIIRTAADGVSLKATTQGYFSNNVELSQSWKHLITNILRVDIANGNPPSTIEELASEFGVSSQTLRRRLKAEGTSYRSLKAEARREIALDVLGNQNTTLSEASIAAGFAEPNALTRALKASKGTSPQELREQVRRWRDKAPHAKPQGYA